MKKVQTKTSNPSRLMGSSRVWLQILVLITVFACGGISGAFLAVHKARNHMRSMLLNPKKAADQIARDLTSKLNLDNNQAAQVGEIVKRRHAAIVSIRRDSGPRFLREFEEMEKETLEVLDSDQQEEFRKIAKFIRDVILLPEALSEVHNGTISQQ